jgi:hypothetical protein
MAYGLSIQSYLTVLDSKGKTADINFNHPTDTSIDVLKTAMRELATRVDALITGQVVYAGIVITVVLSDALDIKDNPTIDSDVEEGGRFVFETSEGALTTFRLPTIDETWFDSVTGLLEFTEDDAVDDFIQRVISGQTVVVTNVSPSDVYGDDITAFVSASENFLTSR